MWSGALVDAGCFLPGGGKGEVPLGERLDVAPVRCLEFRDDGVGGHISFLVSPQKSPVKFQIVTAAQRSKSLKSSLHFQAQEQRALFPSYNAPKILETKPRAPSHERLSPWTNRPRRRARKTRPGFVTAGCRLRPRAVTARPRFIPGPDATAAHYFLPQLAGLGVVSRERGLGLDCGVFGREGVLRLMQAVLIAPGSACFACFQSRRICDVLHFTSLGGAGTCLLGLSPATASERLSLRKTP